MYRDWLEPMLPADPQLLLGETVTAAVQGAVHIMQNIFVCRVTRAALNFTESWMS